MHRISGPRVVLCGLVAGLLWHLLSGALLSLVGAEFLASVEAAQRTPPRGGAYFLAIDATMGVWALCLYAAIRGRWERPMRPVVLTALGWWTMKSLQSAKWAGLGLVQIPGAAELLAGTLAAAFAAVWAGAWLYDR